MIFRTSIKTSLKKKCLFRGTLIAAIGLFPLLYASIYFSNATLSYLGLPLFFSGLGMICLGMLPFRKLSSLEMNPNRIEFIQNEKIIYFINQTKIFTIPLSSIEKMFYQEIGALYGIAICLKNQSKEKVIVHKKRFMLDAKQCTKKYSCDLFFPYFTQKAYSDMELLRNHLPACELEHNPRSKRDSANIRAFW